MSDLILFQNQNGVGLLTLNQPESLNAMNEDMGHAFKRKLEEIENDPSVKVVIITGSGRAFSSGGNLEMLEEKFSKSAEQNKKELTEFYSLFLKLRDIPQPVIACINGHAVGAGFCVSLACDLRYASKKAKLGANFAKIGLAPGMGGTYLITRLAGPTFANEIMMLADVFDTNKAQKYGLLNDVFEPEDLMDEVMDIATKISKNGPLALSMIKKGTQLAQTSTLQEMFIFDSQNQANCFESEDIKEGIDAIRNKREPNFKGK